MGVRAPVTKPLPKDDNHLVEVEYVYDTLVTPQNFICVSAKMFNLHKPFNYITGRAVTFPEDVLVLREISGRDGV